MAFSYTTDWVEKPGKFTRLGGTWSSAGATSGTISFGPINGQSVKVVHANVTTQSTANTTLTAWKVLQGGATTQSTISITASVSNDTGHWIAEYV